MLCKNMLNVMTYFMNDFARILDSSYMKINFERFDLIQKGVFEWIGIGNRHVQYGRYLQKDYEKNFEAKKEIK